MRKTQKPSLVFLMLILSLPSLAACHSPHPQLSLPHVSFNSVDIAPDGSYLVVGGFLTDEATRAPSDNQPYSQNPGRLWRYSPWSGYLQMLRFPLDVSRGRLSPSGYLAFYGTDQPYQFIQDEIWFTTDVEAGNPVRLEQIPPNVAYWTWHPCQDVLLLGINNEDGTFSISLYDPLEDRIQQDGWYIGRGELGSFALSPDTSHLALSVDGNLCVFDTEDASLDCRGIPVHNSRLSWSPDGDYLAYNRCSRGNHCPLVISNADGTCEVDVADASMGVWENETVLWGILGTDLYRLDLTTVIGIDLSENNGLVCP